jgi:rod shape-determining protein MreD
MIERTLRWAGLILFVFILQTTIVPVIAIFGVKPDLILLVLVFFAFKTDVIPAVFTGFILGLAQDFYSPEVLGLNALVKSLAGFIAGFFNEKVMRIDPIFQLALLFLIFIIHDAVYLLVHVLKSGASFQMIGTELLTATLPRTLYSLFFALIPILWEFLFSSRGKR